MKRSAPPRRKTAVKKSNPARKRREFARAYGSKERVAFVKSLPCVVYALYSPCAGEIHNHHITTGGRGRKADADQIVPLCTKHHAELHADGASEFQANYAVNFEAAAASTELRWQIASKPTPLMGKWL